MFNNNNNINNTNSSFHSALFEELDENQKRNSGRGTAFLYSACSTPRGSTSIEDFGIFQEAANKPPTFTTATNNPFFSNPPTPSPARHPLYAVAAAADPVLPPYALELYKNTGAIRAVLTSRTSPSLLHPHPHTMHLPHFLDVCELLQRRSARVYAWEEHLQRQAQLTRRLEVALLAPTQRLRAAVAEAAASPIHAMGHTTKSNSESPRSHLQHDLGCCQELLDELARAEEEVHAHEHTLSVPFLKDLLAAPEENHTTTATTATIDEIADALSVSVSTGATTANDNHLLFLIKGTVSSYHQLERVLEQKVALLREQLELEFVRTPPANTTHTTLLNHTGLPPFTSPLRVTLWQVGESIKDILNVMLNRLDVVLARKMELLSGLQGAQQAPYAMDAYDPQYDRQRKAHEEVEAAVANIENWKQLITGELLGALCGERWQRLTEQHLRESRAARQDVYALLVEQRRNATATPTVNPPPTMQPATRSTLTIVPENSDRPQRHKEERDVTVVLRREDIRVNETTAAAAATVEDREEEGLESPPQDLHRDTIPPPPAAAADAVEAAAAPPPLVPIDSTSPTATAAKRGRSTESDAADTAAPPAAKRNKSEGEEEEQSEENAVVVESDSDTEDSAETLEDAQMEETVEYSLRESNIVTGLSFFVKRIFQKAIQFSSSDDDDE
ncbi:hypothetical protein STCU_10983 [Strigomonas culicis]|uniref:Uncharacterized protein n=1 Tax=Strigomonas culicis TaxID=28005 RepID=S9V1V9_9TRYP|nr:hypothetical protein STCU_10983 [Strigomonas culicis]|eukprot:EPY16800.1 hypothetical protein STCU_10983 [Strigomonas culicis]